MPPLRILFMGTPEFACPSLAALLASEHQVVGVVTQPDRPSGRGQRLTPPPVKLLAEQHGIPVLQPERVRRPEALEQLRQFAPDLIVVVAFGQILPKALLEMPSHGCINVHASLLPRYRGAAPINWCLINGETETGITTMLMDEGLDTGAMLVKAAIPIGPAETAGSLHDRLAELGAGTLLKTLQQLCAGTLHPEPQDDRLTCYAPLLKKELGRLDWQQSAITLHNLVRGLSPWPGAFTSWEGKTLKIARTRPAGGCGQPGRVLACAAEGIEVACGTGSLVVEELQLEGKKRLSAREFLAGCRLQPGITLGEPTP